MHNRPIKLLLLSSIWSTVLFSATAPDVGILLKEAEKPLQKSIVNPVIKKEEPVKPAKSDVTVRINEIRIEGSSIFKTEEWNVILAEFIGKDFDMNGLKNIATIVGIHYQKQGYHAFAFLPEQSLQNGLLLVQVIEGNLGKIIQKTPFDSANMPSLIVADMIAKHQKEGTIINTQKLESSVLIANDIPGVNIKASLEAGENNGETNIVLDGSGETKYALSLIADNYDSRSTGKNKLTIAGSVSNYLAFGESLSILTQKSSGKEFIRTGISFPVGSDGTSLEFSGSRLSYELIDEFATTGAKGSSSTYGMQIKHPFYRSSSKNVSAIAKYNESFLLSSNSVIGNTSDKNTKVVQIGLNGDITDTFAGSGYSNLSTMYEYGDVVLRNTDEINADAQGPNSRGAFSKMSLSASRVQSISKDTYSNISFSGQYAFKNLDSSQKFSLGGPSGVRGFPFAEATGDIGGVLQVEILHKISGGFTGKVFYDYGRIKKDYDDQYSGASAKNRFSLSSAGIGIDYSVLGWYASVSCAWRINQNPDPLTSGNDADGTKKVPQIWLMLSKKF